MPSIRKRIGYLPSINAQETITKIATKEKLSQSKVVGILVEEALNARGGCNPQNSNNLTMKKPYGKGNNMDNQFFKYDDLDEFISDKGITYNTKKYIHDLEDDLSERRKIINEDLLEQFKQFMLFQKMVQDN